MGKTRRPIQLSERYHKKLVELQKKIRKKTGENPSLRELSDKLIETNAFDEVEKCFVYPNDMDLNFKIKFDRRLLK